MEETYVDAVGVDTATTAKLITKKLKVMVAIDKSKNSFYALEWAVEHLKDVMSAEPETGQEGGLLTLVHVNPSGATDSVPELMKKAGVQSTNLFTPALELCRAKMVGDLRTCVKTETMILEGDPKEMICQAVEQTHTDLLVVGSRGLGMIKRAFLGSVSDYCVQHAQCPVLIVQPPRETSLTGK
ncbi:hypothetical protein HA466_0171990 [Hirschfeldia incana]|nr:hypothetical protein HA466_0171990 [Hirschfeldia incana]